MRGSKSRTHGVVEGRKRTGVGFQLRAATQIIKMLKQLIFNII